MEGLYGHLAEARDFFTRLDKLTFKPTDDPRSPALAEFIGPVVGGSRDVQASDTERVNAALDGIAQGKAASWSEVLAQLVNAHGAADIVESGTMSAEQERRQMERILRGLRSAIAYI